MNDRKTKILVSIFIVAVTLLIVGASYAYFTATTNNTNNQQINLSTGTLGLTFSDGNNGFSVNLAPGQSAEKTFTIQNTGDKDAAASMSFLNLKNTYLHDSLIYSLRYSETQDGQYKYLEIDNVPTASSATTTELSNGIIVPAGQTYYYKFRVRLVNLNATDQTADTSAIMNTKFKIDAVQLPDYTGKSEETLQKLQSLNNTITVTSGTPDFRKLSSDSPTTNGLYAAEDDYGTSYYFRGDVSNNYVHFAGMYWRIMRINGDGTLRLLYDGTTAGGQTGIGTSAWNNTYYGDNAYVGYMRGYEQTANQYEVYETKSYEEAHMNKYNSTIKDYLDSWYTTNLSSQASKIADGIFCNDRSISQTYDATYNTQLGYGKEKTRYASRYDRFRNAPTFKCPQRNDAFTVSDELKGNGKLTNAIGVMTLDEANMVGNTFSQNTTAYTYKNLYYWLGSPGGFYRGSAYVSSLDSGRAGAVDYVHPSSSAVAVPVINLTAVSLNSMTGQGTVDNPFEV